MRRHKIRIWPDSNVAFSFTENYVYSLLQNMKADISNVFIKFIVKNWKCDYFRYYSLKLLFIVFLFFLHILFIVFDHTFSQIQCQVLSQVGMLLCCLALFFELGFENISIIVPLKISNKSNLKNGKLRLSGIYLSSWYLLWVVVLFVVPLFLLWEHCIILDLHLILSVHQLVMF